MISVSRWSWVLVTFTRPATVTVCLSATPPSVKSCFSTDLWDSLKGAGRKFTERLLSGSAINWGGNEKARTEKKDTHTKDKAYNRKYVIKKKKNCSKISSYRNNSSHVCFFFLSFCFFDRTFLLTPGVVREILQVPSLWTGQLYGDECKKNSCYVVSDPVHRAGQPLVWPSTSGLGLWAAPRQSRNYWKGQWWTSSL